MEDLFCHSERDRILHGGRLFAVLILLFSYGSRVELFAQSDFQFNGQARLVRGGCIELTGNWRDQKGSVIHRQKIDLAQPFTITFGAYFGFEDAEGADGIAFILHNNTTRGDFALGRSGGGIGYRGIRPSLAVEFDTFHNNESFIDDRNMPADHIAIVRDGNMAKNLAGPVPMGNVEDDRCHIITIEWNPATHSLKVYFDSSLRLVYSEDIINNIFNDFSSVWWGISASTGSLANRHRIVYRDTFLDCQECFEADFEFFVDCSTLCVNFKNETVVNNATWEWSFPGAHPSSSNNRDPQNICYENAGEYTATLVVRYRDFSDTVTKKIKIRPTPPLSAGEDTTLCEGETVRLTGVVDSSLRFWWSPPDGLSNPNILNPEVTPAKTTSYILNGIDSKHCLIRDTVTLTVIENPKVSGDDVIICLDGEIELTPDAHTHGAPEFTWSPSAGLSDSTIRNPVASPRETTVYTLTVGDDIGCTEPASTTVTVTVVTALDMSISDSVEICEGEEVQLYTSGGLTREEYSWEPREALDDPTISDPTARPATTTQYKATVRNGTCVDSAFVTVTVHPRPLVDAGEDVDLCTGDGVLLQANLLSGRLEHLVYSWSPAEGLSDPNSASPLALPTETTRYVVLVSDTLTGCWSSDSVEVRVRDFLTIEVEEPEPICFGDSTRLHASGGRFYKWVPSHGLSNPKIANPMASPEETTIYTVYVSTENCLDSASVTVYVEPLPAIEIPEEIVYCLNNKDGVLLPVLGNDAYVYQWEPGETLDDSSSKTPRAKPTETTRYTLTVTNEAGCKTTHQLTVNVTPEIYVDAGSDVSICFLSDSVRIEPAISDVDSVLWTPATGLDDAGKRNPIAFPRETTMYTLTAFIGECTAWDTVKVTVNPLPTVGAVDSVIICAGETARLTANGRNVRFRWTPSGTLEGATTPSPMATPTTTTRYTVAVTDSNGCSASTGVTVVVKPRYDLVFSLSSTSDAHLPGDEVHIPIFIRDIQSGSTDSAEVIAFRCVLQYNMDKLGYKGLSMRAVGNAVQGWKITAEEDLAHGWLAIDGEMQAGGTPMKAGHLCTVEFIVFLITDDSLQIPLQFVRDEFALEQNQSALRKGCIAFDLENTTIPLSEFCLRQSRGIRVSGSRYALKQNTPNPSDYETVIEYSIGLPAHTQLVVYNVMGAQIKVLANEFQEAGTHRITFDAQSLPAGTYYYRLRSGPYSKSKVLHICR